MQPKKDTRPRVLCVDDDPNVLQALNRTLRERYNISVSPTSTFALGMLKRDGPFAVLLSDLSMPDMNGVTLMQHARELSPYTVRVLLTGYTNLDSALDAINQGHVFRFLTKPCQPNLLLSTLAAAVEQYRLITADRVLLERTLHGSVKVLTDVLAVAQPAAFGRAMRASKLIAQLSGQLDRRERWPIEVAAMLSELACFSLPADIMARAYFGRPLEPAEQAQLDSLPRVSSGLLARIPRLEPVCRILDYQSKHFDGSGQPHDRVQGRDIPRGSRLLKIALDYDLLESARGDPAAALEVMRSRQGWYDPSLLEALAGLVTVEHEAEPARAMPLADIRPGMVFDKDVTSRNGTLLIARGQEVTDTVAARLRGIASELPGDGLVQIKAPAPADPEPLLGPLPDDAPAA